jgi:hypothetical protein
MTKAHKIEQKISVTADTITEVAEAIGGGHFMSVQELERLLFLSDEMYGKAEALSGQLFELLYKIVNGCYFIIHSKVLSLE